MRNLKKILALVLALVMSLSLMATASAGSFQDVTDDNTYKTAIDVLDQLKVFQGFEDGTFKPTSNLNRAQAAVLVYRIATGDVEGKYVDNYTYMAQSKFNDLDGYNWAKGYINYCQNAKIVVGTSDTTFNPGGNVTGYQLMVMVLRTLGYGAAGEFTDPTKWELETAKIAEREGILKNITGGDFGAPAQRQMVAEILFRGLLTETVDYSALTPGGYTKTGETLGKRELGLEEVEGVVTANEFADLNDTSPLPEGKTRLGSYTLDTVTGFDDIGESKLAYIQNGKTVLKIADSGKNAKAESLNEEKNLNRILGEAGIETNSETQRFVNFSQGTDWTSDWKIKYVLTVEFVDPIAKTAFDADPDWYVYGTWTVKKGFTISLPAYSNAYDMIEDAAKENYTGFTYTAEFAIDEAITAPHQNNITTIFNIADREQADDGRYITGEVYVGTSSRKDISDEKSLEQFKTDYINETDEAVVNNNQRGNWLKVIDNDADGKADYILKVIYTMAQVSRVKDDKITLDVKDHTLIDLNNNAVYNVCQKDSINTLTSETVTTKDDADYTEPAAGDVVYYAIIDGNAFAYKADMEVASFEKVNRNTRVATTTDGTEWTESQICEHIVDEAYQSNITSIAGKVSYDVYFDRGGYIAAFAKSVGNDFALITDGWFNSTKNNGYEYAVKVYDSEADEQNVVDLNSSASRFISGLVENNGVKVQNNDWGALKYLGDAVEGGLNNNANNNSPVAVLNGAENADRNRIKTTVAAISGDDILPVENDSVTGRYQRHMINMDEENTGRDAIPTSSYKTGRVYTTEGSNTAYSIEGDEVEVRALGSTVYYVVYPINGNSRNLGVKTFVGYGKVPSVVTDAMIEDVYAVGTRNVADNDLGNDTHYYTANIVVIELNQDYPGSSEVVFLVDDEVSMSNVTNRPVRVIGSDGKEKTVTVSNQPPRDGGVDNSTEDSGTATPKWAPDLYYLTETGTKDIFTLTRLTGSQIIKEGFAIGMVQYEDVPSDDDWITIKPAAYDASGRYIIPDPANNGDAYKVSKETLWTLGYGVDGYRAYCKDAAEAEPGSNDWVLRARKDVIDRITNGVYRDQWVYDDHEAVRSGYNYNRVLLKANSDNEMAYAISFDNLIEGTNNDYDFAYQVWRGIAKRVLDASAQYNTITIKQTAYNATVNTWTEKIKDGAVSIKLTDLAIDSMEWDETAADVIVTGKIVPEIVTDKDGVQYLRLTKVADGDEVTIDYIYAAGDPVPENLITFERALDETNAIYTNFELQPAGKTSQLKTAQTNGLAAGDKAWLYFEVLEGYTPGSVKIGTETLTPVENNGAVNVKTGYVEYKVEFTMPADGVKIWIGAATAPDTDTVEGARAQAIIDVNSYKTAEISKLTGDDATAAANAKDTALAAIRDENATKASIAEAVAAYKTAINDLIPANTPVEAAPEGFSAGEPVVADPVTKTEGNKVTTTQEETTEYTNNDGIKLTSTKTTTTTGTKDGEDVVLDEEKVEYNYDVQVPTTAQKQPTTDDVLDLTDTTDEVAMAAKEQIPAEAQEKDLAPVAQFSMTAEEGAVPQIDPASVPDGYYVVAVQEGSQTKAVTVTWTFYIVAEVQVQGNDVLVAAAEVSCGITFTKEVKEYTVKFTVAPEGLATVKSGEYVITEKTVKENDSIEFTVEKKAGYEGWTVTVAGLTPTDGKYNTGAVTASKTIAITVTAPADVAAAQAAAKTALDTFANSWSIQTTDEAYTKALKVIETAATVEAATALVKDGKLNTEHEDLAYLMEYVEDARKAGALVIAKDLLRDIRKAHTNFDVTALPEYIAVVNYIEASTTKAQDIEDMFLNDNGDISFNPNVQIIKALNDAVAEAAELADAKTASKEAVDSFVEWAKSNVSITDEYFDKKGELKNGEGTEIYAAKNAATPDWTTDLTNPDLLHALPLAQGVAEIKKMIDAAETVEAVKKIFKYDETASPKYSAMSWDSTVASDPIKDGSTGTNGTQPEMCEKFGYTGNLKDYIMQQVMLMLVEDSIQTDNSTATLDFSSLTLEKVEEELTDVEVSAENRATHYLAAAIRVMYTLVPANTEA